MQEFLIEFLVRSTLIAAGTAAILWTLRIRAARVRHTTWLGVVAFMLMLPLWIAWGPDLPLPWLPSQAQAAPDPPPGFVALPPAKAGRTGMVDITGTLAVLGYLAGFCFLLGRLIVGTVKTNLFLRNTDKVHGRLTNPSCTAPLTVGWFRRVVVLPEFWTKWPEAQLRTVLAHESEHVRRRDPLVQWLALLNRALFWFHPLAWWLERELSRLAEQACDQAVLFGGHDPAKYSQHLLEIARSVADAGGRVNVLGMAMPGNSLPERIRQILTGAVHQTSPAKLACVTVASAAVVAAFGTGTLAHAQTRVPQPLSTGTGSPGTRPPAVLLAQTAPNRPALALLQLSAVYRAWLDQEAVYLISEEERNAFLRLRADEERVHFIEQFWLRRDPTPSTEQNEFREEHYRRIAYVNERYSVAGTPGWKTDRGIVYILFGPPDEMELHPNAPPYPLEKWMYHQLEGIGSNVILEFVDQTLKGLYTMTKAPTGLDPYIRRVPPSPR